VIVVSYFARHEVTHPQGELAQLLRFVGQAMRLQIEHELQAVLDLAKKSVRIIKYAILDRKSTRLNSSHLGISYAVFCSKKKKIPRLVAQQLLKHTDPASPPTWADAV